MNLSLDVTQKPNFEFVFTVHATDLDAESVNVYSNIGGADWEYLFYISLDDTGHGAQSWILGSHLVGEQLTFWAGLPGVIASNKVTLTVADTEAPTPSTGRYCLLTALGLPHILLQIIRELVRPVLPLCMVDFYYVLSARILS